MNDFGVGSAIAVFLFLLVIPVLALNIRRFKREAYGRRRCPRSSIPNPRRAPRRRRSCARSPGRRCSIVLVVLGLLGSCRRSASSSPRSCPQSALALEGLVADLLQAEPRDLVELPTRCFHNSGLITALKTTAYIAVGNTLLVVILGAMAGYALRLARLPGPRLALHRRHRPARRAAADGADPDVQALRHVGIFGTVLGIILFHAAFGLPFAIFLLRNFFVGIPKDILESARIDGANEMRDLRAADPAARAARRSPRSRSSSSSGRGTTCSSSLTFGERQPITVWISGSCASSERASTSSRRRRSSRSSSRSASSSPSSATSSRDCWPAR